MKKDELGLDLEELEEAAHMVLEEENVLSPEENMNNMVGSLAGMTVIENDAAIVGNDNQDAVDGNVCPKGEGLSHISDSDSSSSSDSDSDDDTDDDDDTDSTDSSDDSSDDSEKDDSSSDSSDLDSDDDTLSENGDPQ